MRRITRPGPVRLRLPLALFALLPAGPRRSATEGGGESHTTEDTALGSFFDLTGDPLIVVDSDLRIVEANAAAARFLSQTVRRLRGTPVLEVNLLARLLTAASIPQRLKSDAPPVADEVSVTDSEGQPVQCRIEALPLAEERTLIHLQDTTPVLRARAAMRAAEQLHHAALEALPEVGWIMALPEERLLEVSPSVERVFGHQPAALLQSPETWDELVHPAERERVRDEFRRGLAGGQPFEIHFTGLHRDHHDLPHLVNRIVPVRDDQGWVDRCEGFIEDRGIQHRLERTLSATEANLRHVLESVTSGVLVLERAEAGVMITLCNRRLASLLKLDDPPRAGTALAHAPAALRTLVLGELTPTELDRRVTSEDTDEDVQVLEEPHRVLRRYGGPLRDRLGAVVGRILTLEDVTASWTLQRRLTHAQKMESMGRLAGGVAHDFNNLLGQVLGFASHLLDQTPEPGERHEALEHVVRAAERGARLTDALLAFSRSARFERMPVQLNRVLEDTYPILRSSLDPSIALSLRLEPDLPPLLGDALLLQQVVVNLAQEAAERLPEGGSLELVTRRAAPAEGEAGRPGGPRVAFEIVAPAADDAAPRPSAVGSELALTMADDIARAHGAILETAPPEDGVRVRIVFPAGAVEDGSPLVPEATAARGGETVLVVDDEAGMRALARVGLEKRGFRVVTVEDGAQALDHLRGGTPAVDVVILDLTMPGIPGERVLREIRASWPDLPVVIASGYASVESQSSWVAAGAAGFVAKPYRVQDLALELRQVLDRARGRTR